MTAWLYANGRVNAMVPVADMACTTAQDSGYVHCQLRFALVE